MALPKAALVAAERRARAIRAKARRAKLVHTPTAETRRLVWCMSAAGIDAEDVAKVLRVNQKQLGKVYYDELRYGMARAAARVVATLYQVATDPAHPQVVTAAKFWLSSKSGWADKTEAKAQTKLEALKYSDDDALIAIARRGLEGIRETADKGKLN